MLAMTNLAPSRCRIVSPCPAGRLDQLVHVGLPDANDRHAILEQLRARIPTAPDVDTLDLVAASDGLSGAALHAAYRDAALDTLSQALATADELAATVAADTDGAPPARVTAAQLQRHLLRRRQQALRAETQAVVDICRKFSI